MKRQSKFFAKGGGAQEWKDHGGLKMLRAGQQWGWVMLMPSWKAKNKGATGADEAASYPGQMLSVSRFGYRYLCCPCIKHPDTNLKISWILWDPSLYPHKEYWYSLAGSFLCWCEIIPWGAQPAVFHPSSSAHSPPEIYCLFCSYMPDLKQDAGIALLWSAVICLLGCGVLLKTSSRSFRKFMKSLLVLRVPLCVGCPLWEEGWAGPFQPW